VELYVYHSEKNRSKMVRKMDGLLCSEATKGNFGKQLKKREDHLKGGGKKNEIKVVQSLGDGESRQSAQTSNPLPKGQAKRPILSGEVPDHWWGNRLKNMEGWERQGNHRRRKKKWSSVEQGTRDGGRKASQLKCSKPVGCWR